MKETLTSLSQPESPLAPVASAAPKNGERGIGWYFGPAFVASVAYIDPGNFATNIEGGARFQYQLLWVLLWSNLMAILVQNLSAKLGIATGRTLPENCRTHFSRPVNLMFWIAAELGAMATDLAEFLGAALGFYLLFGIPLFYAALLTGVAVFLILAIEKLGFRRLEYVIMFFVAVIGAAYAVEVWMAKPQWKPILEGILIPRVHGDSIYVAVGMLGATVMPHVVYLHSALVQHRYTGDPVQQRRHRLFELLDVLVAMNAAWLVNSAMVVMAAAVFFRGGVAVHSIEGAHRTLAPLLGPASAMLFAVALLCSGLSSSTVGTMAGQIIMGGFLNFRMSLFARRAITMAPAMVVISMGLDPLRILVFSQVCLSFALPFALVPLIVFTRRRDLMGEMANSQLTNAMAYTITGTILLLNGLLLYQTFGGTF